MIRGRGFWFFLILGLILQKLDFEPKKPQTEGFSRWRWEQRPGEGVMMIQAGGGTHQEAFGKGIWGCFLGLTLQKSDLEPRSSKSGRISSFRVVRQRLGRI